jgi:quercetin dioxygenase-like cupin family protein
MITTPSSVYHSGREERRVDAPFMSADVPSEIGRLRVEHAYETEGHAGRTLAKYPDLRVVLEAMKRGVSLAFHETAERMTLYVVLGQVRVSTGDGEQSDLTEGSFAAIEAARVLQIECLEECAFVLTVAWPPAARRADVREEEGTGI